MTHPNTRYSSTRASWRTLLLAGVLALGFVAVAGAATWNNPAGGLWSNPANWSPAEVPDAPGESAVLPALSGAYQVTLDINPAIDGLALGSGATLDLNGSSVSGPGLTIGQGATVRGAGVIDMPQVTNAGLLEGDGPAGYRIQINGLVYNIGTIRVVHGGGVNVNRPLVMNNGGTITSGDGGGTFSIKMPYDMGGTLDSRYGGRLVADGGDLTVSLGTLFEGTVQRGEAGGAVNIGIATLQNLTVAAGAELGVTGHADLMAAGTSLTNNGTVRVKGSINFGIYNGDYQIFLGGKGVMILDGGTLGSGTGATLVNQAGQTITGCGTINSPFVNEGTVDFNCGGSQSARFPGPVVNRGRVRVLRGKLSISGAAASITNHGTISASSGTITLEKGAAIDNTGGLLAADGGNVYLGGGSGATVTGGRLDAGGGSVKAWKAASMRGGPGFESGSFQVQKAVTLRDVTLGAAGTLVTAAGGVTTLAGAQFVNQGTNRIAGTLVVSPETNYIQTSGATVLERGTISATRDLQILGGTLSGMAANKPLASPTSASAPQALQFYARTGTTGASFVLELPHAATLDGRVYDAAGREVARIADGTREAGVHTFAVGVSGALPDGIYFGRMVVTMAGEREVLQARIAVVR